jgi:antibiotic biosynthesis monooxygenase (ABM) superfamily enzyme
LDDLVKTESAIVKQNIADNFSNSRLTAIWAFSESAFGGILHAISIPFRGILINAVSVILITLIAIKSSSKSILKSTLIVVIIKTLVSPHSPLTAHFAVTMQGIIGSLLFKSKRFFRLSAFLLGIITLVLSGTQKIIILTILFGNNFWSSINIFIKQISKDFLKLGLPQDFHYGFAIIGLYVTIHLIAGIMVGYYAGLLPSKLDEFAESYKQSNFEDNDLSLPKKNKKGKKKSWIQRPSGIILISVLLLIMIYSYLYPYKIEVKSIEILIMIIRAFLLTIIWYFVFVPLAKKLFSKFVSGKKNLYSQEVDEIINLFPRFREIVSFCWKTSLTFSGLLRIKNFLTMTFYFLLFSEMSNKQ